MCKVYIAGGDDDNKFPNFTVRFYYHGIHGNN